MIDSDSSDEVTPGPGAYYCENSIAKFKQSQHFGSSVSRFEENLHLSPQLGPGTYNIKEISKNSKLNLGTRI